jgi:hypothetical protein
VGRREASERLRGPGRAITGAAIRKRYALPKASLFLGKVQQEKGAEGRGTDVDKEAIQRRTHTRGERHHTSTTTQMMIMRTMTPNQAKDISSPHRGADSSSDRASSSTNHCARRAGDEKTAGAAEASASQSRAAADRQRGNDSQHQPTHAIFPRRENYRPQPLTDRESLLGFCRPLEAGETSEARRR